MNKTKSYVVEIMGNRLDLTESFNQAFVFLPSGFRGAKHPISGSLIDVLDSQPQLLQDGEKISVMVMLPGSKALRMDKIIAQNCCEKLKICLITLNNQVIKNRPIYESPASDEIYEAVHKIRTREVDQFLARIDELPWIRKKKYDPDGTF